MTIGAEFRSAFQSALSQQWDFWRSTDEGNNDASFDRLCGGIQSFDDNGNRYHRHNASPHPRGNRPCAIVLGDRPVRITLLRAWESLRLFGKIKLVLGLLWSSIRQPSEKELQEWMDSILNDRTGKNDLLTKAMEELGRAFPTLKKVIIEERDEFMVAKLRQTAEILMHSSSSIDMGGRNGDDEKVIVAVVGAGHCPGMLEKLKGRSVFSKGGDYPINTSAEKKRDVNARRPEEVLPSLVETKKWKISNNEEISSLVTDIVRFDHNYALHA